MKIIEALQALGLQPGATPEEIKLAYRRACKAYHPDRNPGGLEIMKIINIAYEALKDYQQGDKVEGVASFSADYIDILMGILNALSGLPGLELEICGVWVWIGGNTKENKEKLKELGCYWSKHKLRWYYRPAEYKSYSRGGWDMEKIRDYHGSMSYRGKRKEELAA